MQIEPEYGSASVVLLGSFNPRIFNPDWLAQIGLISDAERAASEIGIIHEDVAQMRVGSRNLHVEKNRFSVDTTEAPFIALADFANALFSDVLPQTPITRLGINRVVHFRAPSEAARNKVGRLLAPLEPWGEWGKEINDSPPQARGGALTLVMQKARLDGDLRGGTTANLQPSVMPTLGNTGIYMAINDDFFYFNGKKESTAQSLLEILLDRFDSSMRLADRIIDHIMTLSLEAAR